MKKGLQLYLGLIFVLSMVIFAYGNASAQSGVVGHWTLNEGNGQTVNALNGSNGQLGSSVSEDTYDPIWTTGIYGSTGLNFSGSNFVNVPCSNCAIESQDISVEMWIKSSSTPSVSTHLLSKGGEGCSFASFTFWVYYEGGLRFEVASGSGQGADAGPTSTGIWDGKWHHVVGTYNGSAAQTSDRKVRLYVDGTEVGSGTQWNGPINYSLQYDDLIIGSYWGGGCNVGFNGAIDDVTIWDRVLSATEIAERWTN